MLSPKGFPQSTPLPRNPVFTPKKPVVCTEFAVRAVSPPKSDGDVRQIFTLRLGWTDHGGQASKHEEFRRMMDRLREIYRT
jgi:hypothetical protein